MVRPIAIGLMLVGTILVVLALVPGSRAQNGAASTTAPAGAPTFDPRTAKSDLIGKPAPAFSLDLLGGGKADLASHKGNDVVVLDFWATWCAPCVRSLPMMSKLVGKYEGQGVVLYAVNDSEDLETVKAFVAEKKFDMPIALDLDGAVVKSFGAQALPVSAIIDKQGVVRAVHYGFFPGTTDKQIEADIRASLGIAE